MKIHDDHLYHGAALIQIAEHPQFTAINSWTIQDNPLRSGYKINNHIGIYLKYCVSPTERYEEYAFSFNSQHLDDLRIMKAQVKKLFLVMVCIKVREICCIEYDELMVMITNRHDKKGEQEDQYVVKVTIPKGQSMRVYMDVPGKKKIYLGKPMIVSRKAFPDLLFE
jgi:hypothetical protein